jgi:hypothetical protein
VLAAFYGDLKELAAAVFAFFHFKYIFFASILETALIIFADIGCTLALSQF